MTTPAKPFFYPSGYPNGIGQLDLFPFQRVHADDVLVTIVKVHTVDAGKQFLQVGLDNGGFGGLAQDLKKVFINDEVEPRESGPLFF